MRVLHVAAELFPYVKTGGLADVVAALPPALARQGVDARLLLPGYPALMKSLGGQEPVADLGSRFGSARVHLVKARLPDSGLVVYLIDAPWAYRREGGPYQQTDGLEWPDNLQRFALLGWVGAQIAAGGLDRDWAPQLVHTHDWHAGLTPTYLRARGAHAIPIVHTVHNLAFQGLFPWADGGLLELPSALLGTEGIEFHGQLSFMKGGLVHADTITTVSPTYAQEMGTPTWGHGLDGVVRSRGNAVVGILNGIDTDVWNPAADPALPQCFSADAMDGKRVCKRDLQRVCGLHPDDEAPVLVVVSRLTHQKGVDLLVQALPAALDMGLQIVVQGEGEPALESAWRAMAAAHAGRVAAFLDYDEARAHRLFAGADVVALPSRFEPCGLTQLYGLRYGAVPVVHRVGGLADTVVDVDKDGFARGAATGFTFDGATTAALLEALQRVVTCYRQPHAWAALRSSGMAQDFSWQRPARDYLSLYRTLSA